MFLEHLSGFLFRSKILWVSFNFHCVKSIRIRSCSSPHFPAFGLNTEKYSASLHIRSESGKMRTKITPNADTFYTVFAGYVIWNLQEVLQNLFLTFKLSSVLACAKSNFTYISLYLIFLLNLLFIIFIFFSSLTIIHKICETNSTFDMKQRIAEKVQLLFFRRFLLVRTKRRLE